MRVKLLKDYRGRRAGAVFVPPWDHQARELIRAGIAEAVNPGDAKGVEKKAVKKPVPVVQVPAPVAKKPTAKKAAAKKPAGKKNRTSE